MPDDRPYRLYAMEIASLAGKVSDPELAAHYRRLAASYMALARFHEQAADRYSARSGDPLNQYAPKH